MDTQTKLHLHKLELSLDRAFCHTACSQRNITTDDNSRDLGNNLALEKQSVELLMDILFYRPKKTSLTSLTIIARDRLPQRHQLETNPQPCAVNFFTDEYSTYCKKFTF